jgi:hypothetical protein
MANQRIIIEGEKVFYEEYYPKREVPITAFMESMRHQFVASTPIIPREVVGYFAKKERHFFLIEEEPTERELRIRSGPAGSRTKTFTRKLKLPWIYHLAYFYRQALEQLVMFCMPKRITSIDEKPCFLPLPNVGSGNVLCTGNSLSMSVTGSLHSKVKKIVSAFWSSEFNFDLSHSYNHMPVEIRELTEEILNTNSKAQPREPGQGSWFLGWERLSQKDGFDICEVKWEPWRHSLAQQVENASGGRRR